MKKSLFLLFLLTAARDSDAGEPMAAYAERLHSAGRLSATDESSESLVLNPANIAKLPSWEARVSAALCHEAPASANCGIAAGFATSLPFGFAAGLRFDTLLPPSTMAFPLGNANYHWMTFGLAYRMSNRLSLGASYQWSYSARSILDGLSGLSLGATYTPNPYLAFAIVGNDLNRPSLLKTPNGTAILDSSVTGGIGFRPRGRRSFEIGADARYFTDTNLIIPRFSISADIPGIGRARGDIEVARLAEETRRSVVGSASLEVAWGNTSAHLGAWVGNGLGNSTSISEYGSLAISGFRLPGLPIPKHAVSFRIEKTPGTFSHIALLRKLWRIAEDPAVEGVSLIMRAEPATSFAHAEELADAIRVLRAHGKRVLCSLEDNGARALYVCANADKTVVNPAGGIRFAGLRSQYFYLRELLDKVGVKADILRVSEHKSAPEMFTNDKSSETSRKDHENALAQMEAVFYRNLAQGRKMSETEARAIISRGPFVAEEARAAGLVDGFAFDDELDRKMSELLGHRVPVHKYEEETQANDTFGPRSRVGLLVVEGDMVDGRSENVPILGNKLAGSYTIAEAAKQMREDRTVKSVVLRIETPGGSSMAADVMWRELTLLAKKKPLIVSMGSVAASGGDYIAVAGTKVYALPLTVTGSIGVFYGKADVSGLLKKIGVNVETFKTSPRADAESFFRPFSDDERVELQRKVGQFYDTFLDRVSQGRKMSKTAVDAVGQGRVWTGQEAKDLGLVDELGGLRHAMEDARKRAGLPDDAPILELPLRETTLVERALKLAGIGHATTLHGIPLVWSQIASAAVPFLVNSEDKALARMEAVPVELLDFGNDDENDEP